MARIPVALQLYTVRDECAQDFVGTLKYVAEMGYAGVELTGPGNLTSTELSTVLTDLDLRVAGCHVSLANLENDLNAAFDLNEAVGNKRIVCPWLPPELRNSEEDFRRLADTLSAVGLACRDKGFQLYYHHHDFEFQNFGGKLALDILFDSVPNDLLRAELDTYWIEVGGESASDFIHKYRDRVDLVHIKDRVEDRDPPFGEIGEGTLNFVEIFQECEDAGVAWYIVEQDRCPGPPLESARRSLRNLKMWGKV
ncbi:MAG: sugar phosphate isomerase/epimerase [Chthonomonadales bacterium]